MRSKAGMRQRLGCFLYRMTPTAVNFFLQNQGIPSQTRDKNSPVGLKQGRLVLETNGDSFAHSLTAQQRQAVDVGA